MNNNDERDYAEERFNRALMREEDDGGTVLDLSIMPSTGGLADAVAILVPFTVQQAIAALVDWNWADEERDYNTEAIAEDNSRNGHIFESVMLVQRWLEMLGFPHVEPHIVPDPREQEQETAL